MLSQCSGHLPHFPLFTSQLPGGEQLSSPHSPALIPDHKPRTNTAKGTYTEVRNNESKTNLSYLRCFVSGSWSQRQILTIVPTTQWSSARFYGNILAQCIAVCTGWSSSGDGERRRGDNRFCLWLYTDLMGRKNLDEGLSRSGWPVSMSVEGCLEVGSTIP